LQRRDHLEQIITAVPGIQVGGYVEEQGLEVPSREIRTSQKTLMHVRNV
jgi:hypothetical protein